MDIVTVANLKKTYGDFTAVDEIDFTIKRGEIFGFLGPNGAGKTSTINMMIGLSRPTQGKITIDGIDVHRHPKKAQAIMGIVPDESNLYNEMDGFENLCFCAALYGMGKEEREPVFGIFNAFVPIIFAAFFINLGAVNWGVTLLAVVLIAITSTLTGLLIAVSAKQVFEAQTFSNFFRFPMLFLCGLFVPLSSLPIFLRPVSFLLPLTYGTDILNGAIAGTNLLPPLLCYGALLLFVIGLFLICLHNINRKWIL